VKTLIVILILFLIQLSGIQAQDLRYTQTIRGNIIDASSKNPIEGVSIYLNSSPVLGTITNNAGEFEIKNVPIGSYEINIGMTGYKPVKLINQTIKSGKEFIIEIELEELVIVTDEVVIRGHGNKDKPLNEMATISARSFTVDETERYAGSLFDPARMASNYAGIMTVSDQRNDIIIRGNSPLGLLWRLEGVDIPNPNHFGTLGTTGGPISILNNNLLSNSDFFTSAFPAEYGNALSGVFDLNLRNGNNKKHEFIAQIGMNGFELGAEGPFSKNSKASYLVSYRYSTLAIFNALGIDFGVSGIPQYQDLSFKINIPGTKAGKFSFFGVAGTSYIEMLDKDRKEDDWTFGRSNLNIRFGSKMGVVGLKHQYFFSSNTRLNSTISISYTETSTKADSAYEILPPLNYYGDESSEIMYSLSSRISHKMNAKGNLSIGVSADLYNVFYMDSAIMQDYTYRKLTNTSNELALLYQGFVQFQYKFTDDIVFYSGLHYQLFNLNTSQAFEPRANIKWNMNNKHALSMGFGFHSQLQPRLFYFLETTNPDKSVSQTNRDLGFSKSNQFVIGYDYSINKDFRLKFETYYQYLFQVPVEKEPSSYSVINYGSDFYSERSDSLINQGTGVNYGVELTLEKFLSKNYYFLITTSLFESRYKASDNVDRNTIFNGNYVVNLLSGYSFKIGKYNALNLDLKIVNAGGRHYIPVDLEKSQLANTRILDYEQAYLPQYPSYFRIDTRISFKLNRSKFNAELAFDLQNITQHQNILLETYDVESGSIKYDYQLGLFYFFLLRFQF